MHKFTKSKKNELPVISAALVGFFSVCPEVTGSIETSFFSILKTNNAPENGWLEDDRFLLGPIFEGYVGFREGTFTSSKLRKVPCMVFNLALKDGP